jgi:hypothetical protein
MKKFLFFISFFFFALQIKAQVNLVPNPSFEDTIDCYTPKFWTSFGNSPDYYNLCENSVFLGTPSNGSGYQYAANGNAYIGLFSYLTLTSNQREFIGVKLADTLIPNTKYYISIKINLANMSNIATNKIGVLFSKNTYSDTATAHINNHAHLFSASIILDTLNWIKLSSSFIADSTYSYLIIGNFFNDLNTSITTLSASGTGAYYFIDEVCVSTDSLLCSLNTGIEQSNFYEQKIEVFPNPTSEYLYIKSNRKFSSILFDMAGKKMKEFKNSHELEVSEIENGVYILTIFTETKSINKKITIIH